MGKGYKAYKEANTQEHLKQFKLWLAIRNMVIDHVDEYGIKEKPCQINKGDNDANHVSNKLSHVAKIKPQKDNVKP